MKKIDELVQVGQEAGRAGLVVSSSGNISVRLGRARFAISVSGASLSALSRRDICFSTLAGAKKKEPVPSTEEPLHRSIYREQGEAGAVLHFQSPWATSLACSKKSFPDLNFIPEVPVYIGRIREIPFHPPGDPRLADAVGKAARDPGCSIFILRNHGQISLGEDLKTVLRNAELFEFACGIACMGLPLRRFPRKVIDTLRNMKKA
jgi:ribulose-5-phosphate 4-epimerase/fuculose-1-phosphate aldolase